MYMLAVISIHLFHFVVTTQFNCICSPLILISYNFSVNCVHFWSIFCAASDMRDDLVWSRGGLGNGGWVTTCAAEGAQLRCAWPLWQRCIRAQHEHE